MDTTKQEDNKKIVLLGGGGHCVSVVDTLKRLNTYDDILILDPNKAEGSELMGCTMAGDDGRLAELYLQGYVEAFVSMGSIRDTGLRHKLYDDAVRIGYSIPNIIDPSAIVSEYAVLARGIFVGKNAVINAGAVIGDGCIINTGAIIEHNCSIGAFSHVSVGSIVCGDCVIGKDVFIGAGSTVVNGIILADNAFIKAASLVKENV